MMKEKLANFFKKLNNSKLVIAICAILIGVIFLGAMISLVAHPFVKDIAYTAKTKIELGNETVIYKTKLVLMDSGRFYTTIKDSEKQTITRFGDYGYGKIFIDDDSHRVNAIWFDSDMLSVIEMHNPFKIENEGITYTCGGGIALLVFYCFMICICAAIAAISIVKRDEGTIVFTSKMRLIKRLKEMEQMLGISHDVPVANNAQSEVQE